MFCLSNNHQRLPFFLSFQACSASTKRLPFSVFEFIFLAFILLINNLVTMLSVILFHLKNPQ